MQNRIHHLLRDRTFWGVLTRAAPISHGLGGRAEHRSIAKVVKQRRKEVAGAWGGGAARAMLSSERAGPAAEGHAALQPEATHAISASRSLENLAGGRRLLRPRGGCGAWLRWLGKTIGP